jgi:PTH2 family peptidyl-tRNA hydrolase
MRKGKMIAQGSHASMAFLTKNANFGQAELDHDYAFHNERLSNIREVEEWMTDGFTKVCVQCSSEEELVKLYEQAKEQGLNAEMITDSGFTEFNGVPTKTCIAIGPNKNESIDKITGHLKLL